MKPDKLKDPSPFGKFIFHGHPHCIYIKPAIFVLLPSAVTFYRERNPRNRSHSRPCRRAAGQRSRRSRPLPRRTGAADRQEPEVLLIPQTGYIRIDGTLGHVLAGCGLIAKKKITATWATSTSFLHRRSVWSWGRWRRSVQPLTGMVMELIFIGDHFYMESGSIMSPIYDIEGRRRRMGIVAMRPATRRERSYPTGNRCRTRSL